MSDKARLDGGGQQLRELGRGKEDAVPSSVSRQRISRAPGPSGHTVSGCWKLERYFLLLFLAATMMAWGQIPPSQIPAQSNSFVQSPIRLNLRSTQMSHESIPEHAVVNTHSLFPTNSLPQISRSLPSSDSSDRDGAKKELDRCRTYEVKGVPGSHRFASDFFEAIVSDPDPRAKDADIVWGLSADLSNRVPSQDRAMYISRSTDGGETWTQVARIDSKYFDAGIGEGLRNRLGVSPGGNDFVITTQRGAFQVFPQSDSSAAVVRPIVGPRVPRSRSRVRIAKRAGDPVRAGVVGITADGKNMIVGYGSFDLNPQIFSYHKTDDGSWIEDGPLPHLPTEMDIFSMQFNNSKQLRPSSLYVGTGDQAYRLSFQTMKWTRVDGVGPDSAIHGMSTVGGLHLAACWGVYIPAGAGAVKRVTDARFLLHRYRDQAGPNLRAYSIEVDPSKPNREVVTSITGVYTSKDSGKSWNRLNNLPEGEFRTAHFNADGTLILSGFAGTFLANPFSNACSPRLKTRDR